MGDRYLTLTGTGAPRLVLAPDPRRNGGPDISDDYQYWKLVSMHDDSGKRLIVLFVHLHQSSGLQIQNVETGGWLEVTNSGTRVQCGMTEVGSETIWDLVLLPTPSALLQGLAGTGAASRGGSSRSSRPRGRRDDDEDTREDSDSSILEYSDDSCDDGWTIRADPVVRHRDGLAHQDITMRKC
ncbi:predicted protein [Aspergillus terreus NIH2624]|uniref:Uncharacterized protein n=1 Tax=Aspergillus terreus (strain NIH 2624 / FGSC A1156) TaxID=341663 RepID=Q0CJF7_ASPTN|nr:uncharacterized protein ATEG_06177 [Aspergillus terreus NIH2624]EAU33938.1 predicted protein [Aspergillus terreus NIH2624]